ncbi:hypothetical protein SJ05684_c36600 [Sinorhizobium sojae CCBAU 05684]|uniref:Uncharacterized protein n=1 Tax=Sinorhizobium sojae CCBAU 05684 TaxID=716928 RepID=A0A249PGH6_9HYPH|nr:hypothetical protein SJ05684_c36600 [Sinorhizobium sojae CCBAU 05684]
MAPESRPPNRIFDQLLFRRGSGEGIEEQDGSGRIWLPPMPFRN